MSDNGLPLKATLKAGTDYSAPWLTVDGADADDLTFKLNAIANGGLTEALVNAANTLKAVNNAAPIAAEVASPPVQQAQPAGWGAPQAPAEPTWGHRPAAPTAAPAAQPGVQLHPEGVKCPVDGNVVQFKRTPPRKSDGKSFEFWVCPNQRSRDDGHFSAFAN